MHVVALNQRALFYLAKCYCVLDSEAEGGKA